MLSLLGLALHAALFTHGAQWTHRYPKVAGFNHHVYLEGYELPVLNPGRVDVALFVIGRVRMIVIAFVEIGDLLTAGHATQPRSRFSSLADAVELD